MGCAEHIRCTEEQAYGMCLAHWMCRGASIWDVPSILDVLRSKHMRCAEHIGCAEEQAYGMCRGASIWDVPSTLNVQRSKHMGCAEEQAYWMCQADVMRRTY